MTGLRHVARSLVYAGGGLVIIIWLIELVTFPLTATVCEYRYVDDSDTRHDSNRYP